MIGKRYEIFYRAFDTMVPTLQAAICGDTAAVDVSLVPTFTQPQEQDEDLELLDDELPEYSLLGRGETFHFIFLVDCSGSMGFS